VKEIKTGGSESNQGVKK